MKNLVYMFICLLCLFPIIGCSNSDSTDPILTDTAKQQVNSLEDSGDIPKLDRSSDIEGIDENSNGIRDDVDSYISTMPVNSDQKKSVNQLARSVQSTLIVDIENDSEMRQASTDMSRSIQCMSIRFPETNERMESVTAIEKVTINTKERSIQYIKFNNALSGTVTKLLKGDTCDE